MTIVLYIHGKGGSSAESEHYKPLFPDCEVIGVDYRSETPWEAWPEIRAAIQNLLSNYEDVILIANSIGAFFSMHAEIGGLVRKAFFISPVVDMEKVNGVELHGEWLDFVRSHPVRWDVRLKPYASLPNITMLPLRSWRMESTGSIRKSRCCSWTIGSGSIDILSSH